MVVGTCAAEGFVGEKEIAYYSSGRPYLKDGSRYISISHTRGYVAVALHSSYEVGMGYRAVWNQSAESSFPFYSFR